jgi:hypothetical protein
MYIVSYDYYGNSLLSILELGNWEIGKLRLLRQNVCDIVLTHERDFPISQFQNFKISPSPSKPVHNPLRI